MPATNWLQRAWGWTKTILQPSSAERFRPLVAKINALEPTYKALSDQALAEKTKEFQARYQAGTSLDALLPEAFAAVREASVRQLGMRHYDVQLLGGIALHRGNVAEMRTGEGKTLVATLPAYLNALAGQGVHVVTVNDYLAERDAQWMGKIYEFLGLRVGVILEEMGRDEKEETKLRQSAYQADITYGTNSAMVFDYLRDNLATSPEERVHRGQFVALVDEVDLLLIDEVRTPLIISGPSREDSSRFVEVNRIISKLQPGVHYRADWKTKTASLTDAGWEKVEAGLKRGPLNQPKHLAIYNAVYQSVLAHCVYRLDVDYIVKGGQVQLIDEHTGRVSPDKRFSDGLHQALEAKEGLRVQAEDRTFARTSYQGYFRLYHKIAGMTGTASTEKEEFRNTYGMGVIVIPTNKDMIRKDYKDSVFATMEDKHNVIAAEIKQCQQEGRPVLVGTCTVRESEQIARLLKEMKIKCDVLNAKSHKREAEIVSQAGRKGAVTISTNMAGRGTDILLGGDPEKLAAQKSKPDTPAYQKALERYEALCAEEKVEVIQVGGLHVIGTSLHDAERLDNQLRGRAGRQGDPGSSQFIICLEDDIFRKYGEAEIEQMLDEYDNDEGEEIINPSVHRRLQMLRNKVVVEHTHERNETFKYDQVIDEQRRHIYQWRQDLLEASNNPEEAKENALQLIEDGIQEVLETITQDEEFTFSEEGIEQIEDAIANLFHTDLELPDLISDPSRTEQAVEQLLTQAEALRDKREAQFGADLLYQVEQELLLRTIDEMWIDHLTAIEHLEDRVDLMSYAQLDPLVLFKIEVTNMYEQLIQSIRRRTITLWFGMEIVKEEKAAQAQKRPGAGKRSRRK